MRTLPPVNGTTRPVSLPFGPILADLEQGERVFTATLAPYRSPIGSLVLHLRHYRGKRLRPALLLLAAKACGKVVPAHHTLAAAVEMIHTATLVHDDVLDDADLRRHVPTINAEWGNKISILFGDALFTHAFHLASRVDVRACQLIGEATNKVCAGELSQVCQRGNLNLSEADYFAIVDGKTAALTEVCGRLGAIYAGASELLSDKLAAYGRNLGLAFQIADDLLDLTGSEETAGKTLGTDLDQLKLTLPIIFTLEKLPECEAEELRDRLRSSDPDKSEFLLERMEETGALTYTRRKAEELIRTAKANLQGLPASECRTILEQLADWSIRREK